MCDNNSTLFRHLVQYNKKVRELLLFPERRERRMLRRRRRKRERRLSTTSSLWCQVTSGVSMVSSVSVILQVNCKKTVKRSTSVDMEVQMVALLKKVQHCVRLKIFHQRPQ